MNESKRLLGYVLAATLALMASDVAWGKAKTYQRHHKRPVASKIKNLPAKASETPNTSAVQPALALQPSRALRALPATQPPLLSLAPLPAWQLQQMVQPAPVPEKPVQAAYRNPYLANQAQYASIDPVNNINHIFSDIKMSLPHLPVEGDAILPVIKTVYPTGEKPLVVITFKCPTELIGITPPTVSILHSGVNLVLDGINRTNLLAFNMQQVCQ